VIRCCPFMKYIFSVQLYIFSYSTNKCCCAEKMEFPDLNLVTFICILIIGRLSLGVAMLEQGLLGSH